MSKASLTASGFLPLRTSALAISTAPSWCEIIWVTNSLAASVPLAASSFLRSSSPSMPDITWPPGILVDSFQPWSQPVIRSISGPWAALIRPARAVTLASMPCFLSIISLISTAWAWCGIIPWANMVSVGLWSAAAGAVLEPVVLWSMPGMLLPELVPAEQPARAMTAARAVAEIVSALFTMNLSFEGIRRTPVSDDARRKVRAAVGMGAGEARHGFPLRPADGQLVRRGRRRKVGVSAGRTRCRRDPWLDREQCGPGRGCAQGSARRGRRAGRVRGLLFAAGSAAPARRRPRSFVVDRRAGVAGSHLCRRRVPRRRMDGRRMDGRRMGGRGGVGRDGLGSGCGRGGGGVCAVRSDKDVHAQKPGKHGQDQSQQAEATEPGCRSMPRCCDHAGPPLELISRISGYPGSTMLPWILFRRPDARPPGVGPGPRI